MGSPQTWFSWLSDGFFQLQLSWSSDGFLLFFMSIVGMSRWLVLSTCTPNARVATLVSCWTCSLKLSLLPYRMSLLLSGRRLHSKQGVVVHTASRPDAGVARMLLWWAWAGGLPDLQAKLLPPPPPKRDISPKVRLPRSDLPKSLYR